MNRIEIVEVEGEKYIVDHLNDYNVTYEIDDVELEQPIGIYESDINEVLFIDNDEDDPMYMELEENHEEIRKIDSNNVAILLNQLLMEINPVTDNPEIDDIDEDENNEDNEENEDIAEENEDIAEENEDIAEEMIPIVDVNVNETNMTIETTPIIPNATIEIVPDVLIQATPETIPTEVDVELEVQSVVVSDNFQTQVEPEHYQELDTLDNLDFSLFDLATGVLTTNQTEQLGNITIEKNAIGQIFINKAKQAHEIIYPKDILLTELNSILQDLDVPASVAESLAEAYLNITEITNDQLKTSQDSFEKYKYVNPIIYNYLKNFKSNQLPQYYKYWLIPIVNDLERVYTLDISNDVNDAVHSSAWSSMTLSKEIEHENKILSRNNEKTERDVNNAWYQSQHAYRYKPSNDTLIDNVTRFDHADYDRQDYTIQVLRYGSIETPDHLELRKADGAVYKVKNQYSHLKKITAPIIGKDHYLSIDGEMVNVVGFLRLPIKTQSEGTLQTFLNQIRQGKSQLKIYRTVAEIPILNETNVNQPCMVIFPTDADFQMLERIFISTIPSLETLVQVYNHKFKTIKNINQINQLLQAYNVTFKDLNEVSHNKVVQYLRTQTETHVKKYLQRNTQLKKLIEQRSQIDKNLTQKHPQIISDSIMTNAIVTNNYGNYSDFNKPVDSDNNRLNWIHKQLDNGQLFYAVLNYLQLSHYITSDPTIDFDKLDANQMTNQITTHQQNLNQQLTIATQTLQNLQNQLANEQIQYLHLIKQAETIKIVNHPLIVCLSSSNQPHTMTEVDLNVQNVYIFDGKKYQPQILYASIQQIKFLEQQISALTLKHIQIKTLEDISEKCLLQISQSQTKLKLLYIQHQKNNLRAQVNTTIKTQDLITPDHSLLDLFKQIKNLNLVKATEVYLKLIETNGMISASGDWILSKSTGQKICCIHKKDQLLELPLIKYQDSNLFCKICHEQIGELDFDTFGGYDADDNPVNTHEGNILDNYNNEFIETAVTQDINCDNYSDNYNKQYACVVLQYLRKNNQLHLSVEQTIDCINLFNVIVGIGDLKTNINVDLSVFYLESFINDKYEPYYKKQKNKTQLTPKERATIKTLAQVSIVLSRELDYYILTLLSVIIILELSNPTKYLDQQQIDDQLIDSQLVKMILQKQLSYKTTSSTTTTKVDNTHQIFNNLSHIIIKNQPLLNQLSQQIANSNMELAVIGDLSKITPSDYVTQKMEEYYQTLMNYSDIKIQYQDAREMIKQLNQTTTIRNISDLEVILNQIKTEPITNFKFQTLSDYENLQLDISGRLKYLDQLRLVRVYQLSNNVFNLVISQNDLIQKLSMLPTNPDCPTDLRQLYIDYLMKMPQTLASPELTPNYQQHPALSHKPYNMSSQTEIPTWFTNYLTSMEFIQSSINQQQTEFNQLQTLTNTSTLSSLKSEISQISSEIRLLHFQNHKLKNKSRLPKAKTLLLEPSSRTQLQSIQLQNVQTPIKKWKILQFENIDSTPTTHIKKLLEQSQKGIGSRIEYLRKMMISHLVHTGFDDHKYVNILTNMGVFEQKSAEINKNIMNLKNKYNHSWNPQIISYLFTHDHANYMEIVKRDTLKNNLYLLHYLVSVIRNQFNHESVIEINDEINNLISKTNDDIENYPIFNQYTYVLSNPEINNLVGVFPRNDHNYESLDHNKYLLPNEINRILHYSLVEELCLNLKKLYGLNGDEFPAQNSQEGVNYCQFIVKFLDLIIDLNIVNDTTNEEVSNLFAVSMAKKFKKKEMNKEEYSIYGQMLKYKLKNRDDPIDSNVYEPVPSDEKPTKAQKLDDALNQAEDIAQGDFQGENEYENADDLGDDVTYD